MANELIYLGDSTETGLTVVARLYNHTGQVGSDVNTSEVGAVTGAALYIANMPAVSAGVYAVRFFSGSNELGTGTIVWDGSAEVTLSTAQTKLNEILAWWGADVSINPNTGVMTITNSDTDATIATFALRNSSNAIPTTGLSSELAAVNRTKQ